MGSGTIWNTSDNQLFPSGSSCSYPPSYPPSTPLADPPGTSECLRASSQSPTPCSNLPAASAAQPSPQHLPQCSPPLGGSWSWCHRWRGGGGLGSSFERAARGLLGRRDGRDAAGPGAGREAAQDGGRGGRDCRGQWLGLHRGRQHGGPAERHGRRCGRGRERGGHERGQQGRHGGRKRWAPGARARTRVARTRGQGEGSEYLDGSINIFHSASLPVNVALRTIALGALTASVGGSIHSVFGGTATATTGSSCAPHRCGGPNAAVSGFGVALRRYMGKDTGVPRGRIRCRPNTGVRSSNE